MGPWKKIYHYLKAIGRGGTVIGRNHALGGGLRLYYESSQ